VYRTFVRSPGAADGNGWNTIRRAWRKPLKSTQISHFVLKPDSHDQRYRGRYMLEYAGRADHNRDRRAVNEDELRTK